MKKLYCLLAALTLFACSVKTPDGHFTCFTPAGEVMMSGSLVSFIRLSTHTWEFQPAPGKFIIVDRAVCMIEYLEQANDK